VRAIAASDPSSRAARDREAVPRQRGRAATTPDPGRLLRLRGPWCRADHGRYRPSRRSAESPTRSERAKCAGPTARTGLGQITRPAARPAVARRAARRCGPAEIETAAARSAPPAPGMQRPPPGAARPTPIAPALRPGTRTRLSRTRPHARRCLRNGPLPDSGRPGCRQAMTRSLRLDGRGARRAALSPHAGGITAAGDVTGVY
jgi:translation initiation factor IF-2